MRPLCAMYGAQQGSCGRCPCGWHADAYGGDPGGRPPPVAERQFAHVAPGTAGGPEATYGTGATVRARPARDRGGSVKRGRPSRWAHGSRSGTRPGAGPVRLAGVPQLPGGSARAGISAAGRGRTTRGRCRRDRGAARATVIGGRRTGPTVEVRRFGGPGRPPSAGGPDRSPSVGGPGRPPSAGGPGRPGEGSCLSPPARPRPSPSEGPPSSPSARLRPPPATGAAPSLPVRSASPPPPAPPPAVRVRTSLTRLRGPAHGTVPARPGAKRGATRSPCRSRRGAMSPMGRRVRRDRQAPRRGGAGRAPCGRTGAEGPRPRWPRGSGGARRRWCR